LELNGADSGTITFSGANATLKIDGTLMPTGVISGFGPGDVIDLKNVPLNSFGYTLLETTPTLQGYNVLQIVDGKSYYLNLQLPQNFTGDFSLSPDGGSGTDITVVPGFVEGSTLIGSPASVLSPYNTPPLTGYSTYPVSVAAVSGGATPNPYGAVVQIFKTLNGVLVGEATGFIIESYSTGGGIILTAAHVLKDDVPPGVQISIYPANATYGNGGAPIFANVPQFDWKPNPAFDDTFFPDPQDDFGIIKVPSNINLASYGVLPIDTTFSGGTVNITGYPGPQTSAQFSQIGSVKEVPTGLFQENTPFSVNGESGGPLWIYNGSTAQAVGIVSGPSGDLQLTPGNEAAIKQLANPLSALEEGYISGATVLVDVNGNNKLDPGEVSTTTDANGNFKLSGGNGPLVAFGGTDTSTGLPFKGQLSAPAGSTDITPLTTLLTGLASDPSAQSKVLSALGLSSTLNLTTFDPIAAAQSGSADGAATEVAGAKVYDTVEMIASALAGAGGTFTPSLQAAFSTLASTLDGAGINFNDKTALSALIAQIAQTESVTLGQGVADTVASVIAAGNAALDHVLQTEQPGAQLLSDVAGVELVEQGAASNAITNAAESLAQLQAIANLFTGTNLSELISQGQTETQNPGQDLGPVAFDGSATTDQNTVLKGTVSAIDLAGHSITYSLDGPTPTGLSFNSDGTFSFDPGSAYKYLGLGESTNLAFHFKASDGQGTDSTATETITIDGLNDNPTATPDSNGVAEGKSISITAAHGVLANDNDPDLHDQLGVVAVNGQSSSVGHPIKGKYGSLTLNADGSYTYHANRDHDSWDFRHDDGVAQDVFKYTVSDGHTGLSTTTLSIVVFDRGTTYLSGENTTLTAGKGQYVLDGSAGGDTLIAGKTDTVLIGGPNDTLFAGRGDDTFVFRPNFGTNTITNFNVHEDTLQFDHTIFSSVRDILAHTTDTASGAVISDGHGDSVTLLGVTSAQLHMHHDDLII
jgi:VCBS repeat-containing protein